MSPQREHWHQVWPGPVGQWYFQGMGFLIFLLSCLSWLAFLWGKLTRIARLQRSSFMHSRKQNIFTSAFLENVWHVTMIRSSSGTYPHSSPSLCWLAKQESCALPWFLGWGKFPQNHTTLWPSSGAAGKVKGKNRYWKRYQLGSKCTNKRLILVRKKEKKKEFIRKTLI